MRYGLLNTAPLGVDATYNFTMSAKKWLTSSKQGTVPMFWRRFLVSLYTSWVKSYGDRTVSGIKASNYKKLHRSPGKLSKCMVAFRIVFKLCFKAFRQCLLSKRTGEWSTSTAKPLSAQIEFHNKTLVFHQTLNVFISNINIQNKLCSFSTRDCHICRLEYCQCQFLKHVIFFMHLHL